MDPSAEDQSLPDEHEVLHEEEGTVVRAQRVGCSQRNRDVGADETAPDVLDAAYRVVWNLLAHAQEASGPPRPVDDALGVELAPVVDE